MSGSSTAAASKSCTAWRFDQVRFLIFSLIRYSVGSDDRMPKPLVIDIAHELGSKQARLRLQKGFGRIREQFGVGAVAFEERWEGDRLHLSAGVLGQKITGRVEVMETSVRIELDLPWGLAMLAEKLQSRIRKAGTLLLEKK
jgi:hypothetical protein